MKLIYNLTIRTRLTYYSRVDKEENPCRLCSGCVGMSKLKVDTRYTMDNVEGNYECEVFDDIVDIDTSEDPTVTCSKYKKIILKKL